MRKFQVGDNVIVIRGALKGFVGRIKDTERRKSGYSYKIHYIIEWPGEAPVRKGVMKSTFLSEELTKTLQCYNMGDYVVVTNQESPLKGKKVCIRKAYKDGFNINYETLLDNSNKVYVFNQADLTMPYNVPAEKPVKNKPIQLVEFRPQDSVPHENPFENKEPITFHRDEGPGHAVIHECGAISWVRDDPFSQIGKEKHRTERRIISPEELRKLVHGDKEPSKEMVEYNKKDVDHVVIMNRRISWNEICFHYVEAFCQRHGYTAERDAWVGGDVGTTICINDMYVGMNEIRYDVDNNIPTEQFEKWYWKALEVYELTGEKWLNYQSFCKGAPDPWPEEKLKKVREGVKKIEQMKKELNDYITEVKKSGRNPLF